MEQLKNRITKSQSRNKIIHMIELYEKYIDDPIKTINIWSSTRYMINNKWTVDLQTNKVERCYSDYD